MRFGGIFIGVLIAAAAAFFVLQSGGSSPPPAPARPAVVAAAAPAIKSVNVYVAKSFIPVGTVVTKAMLDVQPWPEHLLVPGFAVADGKTDIVGMVARSPFQAQEPFIKTKLVNANDPSFISGSLPKGMRAITIQTNEIYGLAGFLAAGDHVDVLLNREVDDKVYLDPAERAQPKHFKITETILTNSRVVAVDQKAQAPSKPEPTNSFAPQPQPTRYEPPRSVTLMVTPENARRLRLAESVGSLSLALRSVEDRDTPEDQALTMISDISQYRPTEIGKEPPPPEEVEKEKVQLVTVVHGTKVDDKQAMKRQLDLDDGIASFTGAASRRR